MVRCFKGEHIGTTKRCIIVSIEYYVLALGFGVNIFDMLVFIAISIRMVSLSRLDTTSTTRIDTFFRGHGLGPLPRTLLHGGQLYYLSVVFIFSTSLVSQLNFFLLLACRMP
jgi:hypothetical protein